MTYQTINSCPILLSSYFRAAHPGDLSCRVVLVDRGERGHGRYVTAVQYTVSADSPEWQSGWETGHYICDYAEAVADFGERAEWHKKSVAHISRAGGAS